MQLVHTNIGYITIAVPILVYIASFLNLMTDGGGLRYKGEKAQEQEKDKQKYRETYDRTDLDSDSESGLRSISSSRLDSNKY